MILIQQISKKKKRNETETNEEFLHALEMKIL